MLVKLGGGGGVWATKVTSAGLFHSCDPCILGVPYPGISIIHLKKAFKNKEKKHCSNAEAAMLMNSKLNHF
jgi:hypothetical protein